MLLAYPRVVAGNAGSRGHGKSIDVRVPALASLLPNKSVRPGAGRFHDSNSLRVDGEYTPPQKQITGEGRGLLAQMGKQGQKISRGNADGHEPIHDEGQQ